MKSIKWQSFKALVLSGALALPNAAMALSNFVASSDATNVKYSYSYPRTAKFLRVYLDTDRNSNSGYRIRGMGADYLIENSSLFKYSGVSGQWGFTRVGASNIINGSNKVSFSVLRSSLGAPSALNVMANVDNKQYSAIVSQILTSPAPTPSPSPAPSPTPVVGGSNVTVNFAANTAYVPNPDRGFYHDMNCGSPLYQPQLVGYRTNEGITIIHCYINMSSFVTTTISQAMLDTVQNNMNVIRGAGLKAVVRFTYNMSDNAVDPVLSLLTTHIDQLAPIFTRNADVISTVQAGFVGSWGEWANSQHYGALPNLTSQNWLDRKVIMDKLLAAVPAERTVQLRTPNFKRQMYGLAALTSSEAFSGSVRSRIGHHNDCFLTTSSDWGTYINTTEEYPYLAEDTKYTPMGGETCSYMAPRSDCSTALKETAMFHWSYLNLDYNQNVLNAWRTQGCFDQIREKLGYRFQLQSASLPTSAKVGAAVNVGLSLQNSGFASPFNQRGLELVLRNSSTGVVYKVTMKADPRRWLPGAVIAVNESVVLPASIPAGSYSLLLNLPDPAPALAARPEYSIQLANLNMWEPATGFNKLNATLVIAP